MICRHFADRVANLTIRLERYLLSVTLTMAQTNPLTLRPPPGALPEWRAAAERAGLTLHAWMRRNVEQGLRVQLANEEMEMFEERQARHSGPQ